METAVFQGTVTLGLHPMLRISLRPGLSSFDLYPTGLLMEICIILSGGIYCREEGNTTNQLHFPSTYESYPNYAYPDHSCSFDLPLHP
ncbi:MAG: hypothetical protein ACJAX1_003095, partial [Neolewinella sp.]